MMGYAHSPADLALGKTVDTLHTGDVARRDTRRALRGDRPQQPLRQAVRPAHRPAARRGRAERRGRDSLLHRRRRAARGCRGRPRRACGATHYGVGLRASRRRGSRDHHGRTAAAAVGEAGLSGHPGHRASDRRTGEVTRRPARLVRRCPADRFADDPPRPELRRPRRQLTVLCRHVGPAGAGAGPASRRTGSGDRWPNWSAPHRRNGDRGRGSARRWKPAWHCARRPSC